VAALRKTVLLLALGLGIFSLGAAGAQFKELGWHSLARWEQPQGLPQNTVFTLLQTRDGYIWLGTRAGVARFDGVSFTTFDNRDPRKLRDNEVWALAESDDSSLWIGTYGGGVSRLKDGEFTVYTTNEGLVGNFVSAFCTDTEGGLWIATDSGVSRFKDGRFTNFTAAEGLDTPIVRSLFLDRDGAVLMGTMKGSVFRFKDGTLSRVDLGATAPSSELRAIYRDAAGSLWLGSTTQGLFRFKDGQATWYDEKSGIASNRVMSLHGDGDGNLWIGTTNGLVRWKDDRFSLQALGEEVTSKDYVMALATDHEGSLWAGTADRGLVCIRRNLFRSYTMADGLLDEYVAAIGQDRNGDMLLGSRKGVTVLRDGQTFPYSEKNGLPIVSLLGLVRDRDDTLWIGTEDGLYYSEFDPKSAGNRQFKRLDGNEAIRHISARVVLKDRSGAIWIGTTLEGLVRLENGRFTTYTMKDGLSSNAIRGLCEDRDGNLWIGTRGGGLMRFKDGRFTTYTEKDGLVSDIVQTLYLDHDDTLWIGTRQGLGRLKNGRFTRYTVTDGLFVNYVSGISEDRLGNLWMGGAKGAFRVALSDLTAFAEGRAQTIKSIGYGAEHGLSSTVGSVGIYPSVYTSDDGLVWFGTFNGATMVDPALLSTNRLPPPVHIADVSINQRSFAPQHSADVPPGRGDLAFRYSGVSFLAPEKMKFRYRLEGYDLDWVDAGPRREAFYSNIPPGAYTFHVVAANSDGVWNDKGASFAFRLEPHLYQTGWFRGVLGLAALGAVFAGFRLRVRHIRRRSEELRALNIELERRIAARTAELAKSYDALRASEYFYQSLVESLPQIILRKDLEGRITYANAAFGELVGRTVDEVVGHFEKEFYPAELAEKFRADDRRVLETHQAMEFQSVVERPGRPARYLQVKKVPLYNEQKQPIGVQVLFWDMTVFRETEEKLKVAQRELIEISRMAGIAEVATGVLHNLGNALNSVNTSVSLAAEGIRTLRIPSLGKVAELLAEQGDRLAEFIASDPRGKKIPEYLMLISTDLQAEQQRALREIAGVRAAVDHIKEIVAAQQSFAQVAGVSEVVQPSELLEYALHINEASLKRHEVKIQREIMPTPPVSVSRGKALQILGNLIRNAKDSLEESGPAEKRLTLGVRTSRAGNVQLYVSDNGKGIAPENLTRLFAFGFTTKKSGHGFGLHSSALAARELGGSLTAHSDGPGTGATFILELSVYNDGKAAKL
jgi:PAS domain S-box-containing protein